jgi:uncharacterized membrane protein
MISEIVKHIHPIIVHFPITLIFVGAIFDTVITIKNRKIHARKGLWIWCAALLGVFLAVFTGPDEDARGNTTLLRMHEDFADLTMWLMIALCTWRIWFALTKKEFKRIALSGYLILTLGCAASVAATGYYGGMMVYDQGIGVSVNGKSVNPPVHHKRFTQKQG